MPPVPSSLKFMSILTASALALATTACSREREDHATNVPPQSAQDWAALTGFTAIDATGPDNVVVTLGNSFSVQAEGDARAIKLLDIHVEGEQLVIKRRSGGGSFWGDGDSGAATVRVTLPAITGANLTGSGDVSVDRVEGKAFDIDLTGSGNLKIASLKVGALKADLTGSGDIDLAGNADDARFSVTGSGNIEADKLVAGKGDASVLGSGNIGFASDGAVAIKILGSGDVTVKGKAQCTTSGTGSGEAHCAP